MDGRKNNGGARRNSGRKKGIGIAHDIQKHCQKMIEEMLSSDAIKLKATKQLALLFDDDKEDYLYIIENSGFYKIGYSSGIKKRMKHYETHMPELNIIYVVRQRDCFSLEEKLHALFVDKRVNGEWFDLDEEDLFEAIQLCSKTLIE